MFLSSDELSRDGFLSLTVEDFAVLVTQLELTLIYFGRASKSTSCSNFCWNESILSPISLFLNAERKANFPFMSESLKIPSMGFFFLKQQFFFNFFLKYNESFQIK